MSDLPAGWAWATLGELTLNFDGRRVPLRRTDRAKRSGPFDYYGASGVIDCIDDFLFDGEYLLIAEDGANLATRSKPIAFRASGKFWVNNHAHVVQARGEVDLRFLEHQLNHADIQRSISGSAQPKLTQANLNRLPVVVPPVQEQERIVAAIEEHLSRLDAGLDSWSILTARAEQLDDRVVEEAFASIRERVTVGEVADVRGGLQKQPKRRPRSNKAPFLRVANVGRGRMDLTDLHEIELFDGELERYRLERGDTLVVEGNGSPDQIGRSAVWQGAITGCVHQNHLIRVRPGPEINPEFLGLYWNSPSARRQLASVASSTSGLYTLSTAKVKRVEIPLPPLDAQHALVSEILGQREMISRLRETAQAVAARAAALRRSILAAAFAGELVPQDPDDEPASALLGRIRAERPPTTAKGSSRRRVAGSPP